MERRTNMQVANEILQQLGGNKFIAMTGARHLAAVEHGLSLRLPSNFAKNGINHVQVTLDASDTYSITFNALRNQRGLAAMKEQGVVRLVAHKEGVYSDVLRDVFEEHTGLALSIPRVHAVAERGPAPDA